MGGFGDVVIDSVGTLFCVVCFILMYLTAQYFLLGIYTIY